MKKNVQRVTRKLHTIDASGKILGRIATQISVLLQGKHKPSFQKHTDVGDSVLVTNVSKIAFTGNKAIDKLYYRHSGYLGNLKKVSLKESMEKKPSNALRLAISGMLPKNRLKSRMLKRLTIKD
jgi:large subunit ribosomal protein L13